MDYERESGGEAGQEPDAADTPMTGGRTPSMDSEMEGAGTAPTDAAGASSIDAAGASSEWPAADLAAVGDPDGTAEIAATYAAATEEPTDIGDDSDAPILEDAAATPAAQAPDAAQSFIQADNVTLRQAGAQTIQASTVTVTQGGAGQVHADTMSVEQGGVGLARTKTLTLGAGASAFAVVADEATVEEGSNTFLVVSRTFNGDVQPTIDWRVAAAFGAGLGLALSILRRLR